MKREHMIFVFGSNLDGIHGAGAAKYANQKRGAKWGAGEGLMGTCYALPTKGHKISYMDLEDVVGYIENFCQFALTTPNASYMVTQVGCGLGGFTKQEIAPAFAEFMNHHPHTNLFFDEEWKPYLPDTAQFWGTF